MTAADLRDSVADYRSPHTTDAERADIRAQWAAAGITSQVQAVFRANRLDAAQED